MTNFEMLLSLIEESGLPMTTISKKSGIKRETLYNRLNGIGEFSASEMTGLCDVLHLNKTQREQIFFAKQVESNSTRK